MEIISQASINVIMEHWERGKINRYDIFAKQRLELKSLGVIGLDHVKGYYIIDRARYYDLMEGKAIKQMKLP